MSKSVSPRFKFVHFSQSQKFRFRSSHGNKLWEVGKWCTESNISICKRGFHCSKQVMQAYGYVSSDVLAVVNVKGKHIAHADKECWSSMQIANAYKWTDKLKRDLICCYIEELEKDIIKDGRFGMFCMATKAALYFLKTGKRDLIKKYYTDLNSIKNDINDSAYCTKYKYYGYIENILDIITCIAISDTRNRIVDQLDIITTHTDVSDALVEAVNKRFIAKLKNHKPLPTK